MAEHKGGATEGSLKLSSSKILKINKYNNKTYMHIFDNARGGKSVSITKKEFLVFLKNFTKIQKLFEHLDKTCKKVEKESEWFLGNEKKDKKNDTDFNLSDAENDSDAEFTLE